MSGLMIGLYTAPLASGGQLLLDASPFVTDAQMSTNERGFEMLSLSATQLLQQSFRIYDQPGLLFVAFVDRAAGIIWAGRLEDPALSAGPMGSGLRLNALGHWRALFDATYVALWTTTSVAEWEPILETEIGSRAPKLYAMDTNNRLFIGLLKNTTYGNVTDIGSLTLETPDASTRDLVGFMFAVVIALPNNWKFEVRALDRSFGSAASLIIITGTGATLNRACYLTFSAKARIEVAVYNQTGAGFTFAGENGTNYVRLTQIRAVSSTTNAVSTTLTANRAAGAGVTATVGSTARMYAGMKLVVNSGNNPSEVITVTSVTSITQFVADFTNAYVIGNAVQGFVVYADEIVRDVVSAVNALNSTQLSATTALIQSPALDLNDEIYEDAISADVLTYLIGTGDNQTPPRQWEVGVYDDQLLFFRPQGSVARAWYVDALSFEAERSLEAAINSAYGVYQDANNHTLRTATSTDASSGTKYGITRRRPVEASTTSSTQAGIQRDAYLQDHKDPLPRAKVDFEAIYDANGARIPLYLVRAGDTLSIRNLPPTLSTNVDRLRTFRITHTTYQIMTNRLQVELEIPLPTTTTTIVRAAARGRAATKGRLARKGREAIRGVSD